MTLTFSAATDFETVADGLQTVTLRRADASTLTTTNALRRMVTTREAAASAGKYTTGDVRWHLDDITAVAYIAYGTLRAPAVGERIVDSAGVIWTILGVEKATMGSRYACVTRALEIVYGLDQFVTIQRKMVSKGASGEPILDWATRLQNVRAKLQVSAASITNERGARILRTSGTCYFSEDIQLTDADRIVTTDGTVYTVQSYSSPADISKLPEATVTEDVWPL